MTPSRKDKMLSDQQDTIERQADRIEELEGLLKAVKVMFVYMDGKKPWDIEATVPHDWLDKVDALKEDTDA